MEMENKIIFLKKVVKISTVSPTILQTFTGIGIAYWRWKYGKTDIFGLLICSKRSTWNAPETSLIKNDATSDEEEEAVVLQKAFWNTNCEHEKSFKNCLFNLF